MSLFKVKMTTDLPNLTIDDAAGVINFSGASTIETINAFFPITDKIKKYIKKAKPNTIINCNFDYFNTSTSKAMMDIFVLFQDLQMEDKNVVVKWTYRDKDIDMREAGELYEELTELPFEYICIP